MVAGNEADRQWAETPHQSCDHIIISDDKNLILSFSYLFKFKENYYLLLIFFLKISIDIISYEIS